MVIRQGNGKPEWKTGLKIAAFLAIGIMFLLAIVLRVSLYHVVTSDYTIFLDPWYDFIKTHGGFAALKYTFSNYNTPYLTLLAVTTYLPIPKLIAIKSLSVVFDGVLALFTYLILKLKYQHSLLPVLGALVITFAPTIFINSAAWGQSDAMYTAMCLGSLYFLLKDRPLWACVFFGLAIAFKLQAIFFLPVLLMLLVRRKLPLKHLTVIPVVFLLMIAPALIAGRTLVSVLSIYVSQVTNGSASAAGLLNTAQPGSFGAGNGRFNPGGVPGQGAGGFPGAGRGFGGGGFSSSSLTLNAPSFYQWLPTDAASIWKWVGISLAGLVVVLVGFLVWKSKQRITPEILLKIALLFALTIPFLLPEMHERYFFVADVLSILYAFTFPRLFFIAVIMQLCSLLSYAPYLLHTQIVSPGLVAFAVLAITVVVVVDLVLALYPGLRKRASRVDTFPLDQDQKDDHFFKISGDRYSSGQRTTR